MIGKGLTGYIDGTIVPPSNSDKLKEWNHNNNVSIFTLRKYVHNYLIFLDNCNIVKEAWEKSASFYVKVDKSRGFELDKDLMILDPNYFYIIQDYITKENELRSMVKDYGITIEDEKLIHNLMRKLPPEYVPFVSSFNTHMLTLYS